MIGGIALAGEKELMLPGPEMTFGLQTRVQTALHLQIEQETSGALAEYQVAQVLERIPVINTDHIETKARQHLAQSFIPNLSTGPEASTRSWPVA